MPRMSDSTMSGADFADRYAPKMASPAEQSPQLMPPRNEMARSPIMIASLPSSSSTPDAILRQHLGGRPSSGGRFL